MKMYSFYNDKGGCGKTTLAVLMAQALAVSDYPTLLIDNDVQTNLTTGVFKLDANKAGFSNYISGQCSLDTVIHETSFKNLYFFPYGTIKDVKKDAAEMVLKNIKNDLGKYFDAVLFDQQPRSDMLSVNNLINSICDEICIPIICDEQNFYALLKTIVDINHNWPNKPVTIIRNRFQSKTLYKETSEQIVEIVGDSFGSNIKIAKTVVPDSVDIPSFVGLADSKKAKLLYISKKSSSITEKLLDLACELFDFVNRDEIQKCIEREKDLIFQKVRDKFVSDYRFRKLNKKSELESLPTQN